MSSSPAPAPANPAPADAKTKARETAENKPLENAQTLRGIYNDYSDPIDKDALRFPQWVLEPDRWDGTNTEKSHKFDDTIVVYDVDGDLPQVKELVERREPVNMCINGAMERMYKQDELEKNFGWKHGAYSKSNPSKLYPNIGIYCHARVTNGVKTGAEEKNVHVMNLIGYGFDSNEQPDYQYFLKLYGNGKSSLKDLEDADKEKFKKDLIERYRKIWLKACYICKLKGLKNLWYYGVGNNNFSAFLPDEWALATNFYNQIFAEAFGIDPTDSSRLHSTNGGTDQDIPKNFCKRYGIELQNLGPSSKKFIPDVLFTEDTTPDNTLYINAWDPWSIIGNGNAGDVSLDGFWGRNSNMSVLGWSMTNSKLLPDIVGDDGAETSKILKMSDILAKIQAKDSSKGASSTMSGDTTPPPSKKVAQFFMTYEKNNNGGLNTEKQAEKIVNVVKCLIAKGYKHIGLTYSANQDQTIQVFSDYNYDKNSSTNTFENDQEKNISEEILNGSNQAAVLTKLNDIVKDGTSYSNFKKTFRVIPFTTMRYIKATDSNKVTASDLNETASGNNKECVAAAEEFLKLDDSIILGWCNQDCGGMDDTSSTKQKFAIGGGIAAGLSKATNTYIPEYLTFLESKWGQEVQKIVTDCSPDPKSADSTASPKSSPPAKSAPSKPLDDVIKDLIAGITNTEDPEATLSALSITQPSGLVYKYPPSGDGSLQEDKNLNSAEPNIKKMIEGFESAETGDDTNFYLGACRSIKAAYNLEMEGIKGDDTSDQVKAAKMRAKLLLNLRKNSLLLKVPARWDYATMKMVEVPPPPTMFDELMGYSLQKTIEYYSQDGGATEDEKKRFDELKIVKEPEMNWKFDTSSMGDKGKSGNAAGVDKRFTKGFDNVLGQSCYFSTFLQLLLCDEDFLQLLIISICKQIDYSMSEKKFIIMKNLVDIFKLWFPIEQENIQNISADIRENVTTILRELGMDTSRENDVREVYDVFISNLSEINNNVYIQKFITNLKYNNNNVQIYEGIAKSSVPKNETGYMLLIKPEIETFTTSEGSKKLNTSIQELITDNEKEKVDTNFTLSIDDFVPNSNEHKLYNLYNNIIKRGILSTIRNMCNVKYDDKNKENSTKQTYLNTLNSFTILDKDGAITTTDYSYKNITDLLSNTDYTDIIEDINVIKSLVDTKFSNNNKNAEFNLLDINEQICISANKIFKKINDKLDTLSKPTELQIKKTKVTIEQTHEYIVLDINRTLANQKKNFMNVTINPEITIDKKKYILQGYTFHMGDSINGGHYEFVKCDSLGNPALILNDYGIMNINDIATSTGGGKVNVTSEELRQTGVSSLIYKKADSQAGGGFKPRHNPITNHTASKSRHNSSFKASSSKTKGKSHNRSHTQRVK